MAGFLAAGSQETPEFQALVAHEYQFQGTQFNLRPEFREGDAGISSPRLKLHHVTAGSSPPITTDQSTPDAEELGRVKLEKEAEGCAGVNEGLRSSFNLISILSYFFFFFFI